MGLQIRRIYRDRFLTPEEIASDAAVREAVMAEFPPLERTEPSYSVFGEFLRQAIRDSGRPLESIASEAKVSATVIADFLAGKQDLRLRTADKLAHAIGLKVAVSE